MINKNRNWLKENLRANGISFSKPLFMGNDESIDNDSSKRVEFKVLTQEHQKN